MFYRIRTGEAAPEAEVVGRNIVAVHPNRPLPEECDEVLILVGWVIESLDYLVQ